jgi:ribosomal protein L40E
MIDIIQELLAAIDSSYLDYEKADEKELRRSHCTNLAIGKLIHHPGYTHLVRAAYPDQEFLTDYPKIKNLDPLALKQLATKATLHLGQCQSCNQFTKELEQGINSWPEEHINKLFEAVVLKNNELSTCAACRQFLPWDDKFCRLCGSQNTRYNEAQIYALALVATEEEDCQSGHQLAKTFQKDFPDHRYCTRCGANISEQTGD